MKRRVKTLPGFDPPMVGKDPEYELFLYHSHQRPAQSQVRRFREAGLDAFMERDPHSHLDPAGGGMFLFNVMVARNHLLCAFIVSRLRGKSVADWQRMPRDQKTGISVVAMVDCALRDDGPWDMSLFTSGELEWLQAQLDLETRAFHKLLARARVRFEFIRKRDFYLGMWISAILLAVGCGWGWSKSFESWPVWVSGGVGVVIGVYTLAYSWPRAHAIGISRKREASSGKSSRKDGHRLSRPKKAMPSSNSRNQILETMSQESPKEPHAEETNIYTEMDETKARAKIHLNRDEAKEALTSLEAFMKKDFRGTYQDDPEFSRLLLICRRSLGLDVRNEENQLSETALTWLTALRKGEEALRKGKPEESIVFFQRSINMNPGEAGTSSVEQAARDGIKTAQSLMRRRDEKNDTRERSIQSG